MTCKPFRLEAVLSVLPALEARRIHYADVRGYGRQKGHLGAYQDADPVREFMPKLRLEFDVEDDRMAETLTRVREAARTGRIGDGKIFVISTPSACGLTAGEVPG